VAGRPGSGGGRVRRAAARAGGVGVSSDRTLARLLDSISADITHRPTRLAAAGSTLIARIDALVGGIEFDLDALLAGSQRAVRG
jgi:hypothetical protein